MARKKKITEADAEIVPALVNIGGQREAAATLGVTQATISKWLKDNGYEKRTTWERPIVTEEEKES